MTYVIDTGGAIVRTVYEDASGDLDYVEDSEGFIYGAWRVGYDDLRYESHRPAVKKKFHMLTGR